MTTVQNLMHQTMTTVLPSILNVVAARCKGSRGGTAAALPRAPAPVRRKLEVTWGQEMRWLCGKYPNYIDAISDIDMDEIDIHSLDINLEPKEIPVDDVKQSKI